MTEFEFERLVGLVEAFIAAPTWKAIVILVGVLCLCVLMIAKYFWDRNKREEEAYKETIRIKKEQEENIWRVQRDSLASYIIGLDIAYQQDYNYYVQKIKDNKYAAVFMKVSDKFHDEIGNFLYSEKLTPEQKAGLIIKTVRKGDSYGIN